MDHPRNIQFSQSSLQDYEDCKRRFQLKYLMNIAWPAIETQPAMVNEQFMQRAARFHHMVHQNQLGVQADRLKKLTDDDKTLSSWWTNYTIFRETLDQMDTKHYPEILLQTSINGHRLVAKYDLLLIKPFEKATIIDWKTSRKRPKRSWLYQRLQTCIYPYIMVCASAHLNQGKPFKPEQIEMIYWFANQPNQSVQFKYNSEKYEADTTYLSNLIAEIVESEDDRFPLTEDHSKCGYCLYRSLCNRGVDAGLFEDREKFQEYMDNDDFEIIFDQIAEIEY